MQIGISILAIESFILVLTRVAGILFFAPIFGGRPIPAIAKAGIALWVAFSFFLRLDPAVLPAPDDSLAVILALVGELLIGMSIGLVAQAINSAVQFGGHVIGVHMGFRIANVFDPASEETATVIGAFMNVVVVLLLLSFDFHLILIRMIARSYKTIPPLGIAFSLGVVDVILQVGSNVYLFAVQVVFPVLAAIFFVEVMIGVMAKAARQFNMLMLQFPIKIAVGLIFLLILIKGFPEAVGVMMRKTLDLIEALIRFMSP